MHPDDKSAKMQTGGSILADIMQELVSAVRPGITTKSLDELSEKLCKEKNVTPAFRGYEGFPAALCVGLNDVVVHGIPDDTKLKSGDVLSLDFGIVYEGYYLDMARTVGVGEISAEARAFLDTSRLALENACKKAKTGNTLGDIGHAIQSTVESAGYSVVREMVGHTIGKKLHEDPFIPGYGKPGQGEKLYEGQTVAIEAIINQGSHEIRISREDGWTTRTKDGKLSALFENTVLVSQKPKILTRL